MNNGEKIHGKINELIEKRGAFNEKIGQQIKELCKDLTIENSLFVNKIDVNYSYRKGIYYQISFYSQARGYFHNDDERLITIMKIDRKDFRDQMKKFNGRVTENFGDDYYAEFKTKEDTERALEWVNSIIIMNKLTGESNEDDEC